MKRIKKIATCTALICSLSIVSPISEVAYARNIQKIGVTVNQDNRDFINKKRKQIAEYTGYKESTLYYYSEMTVDGKKCSAYEYVDNGGGASDVILLIFEDGTITGFSPTGEYINVKATTKDNSKLTEAQYTIKKDKIEYKDNSGKVRGIVFFQYPQFKGTSASIKKVNSAIKKESTKFLKSDNANLLKEYAKEAIQNNRFYDKAEQYFWKASCKPSYNRNGIVSFHITESWYAGGVANQYEYGLNYNLNTGKKLTISDVISGNATNKILKAAKDYCGSDTNAYNIIKNTKDYKFYVGDGKVFICYGSYELERGNSYDIFSVISKYN